MRRYITILLVENVIKNLFPRVGERERMKMGVRGGKGPADEEGKRECWWGFSEFTLDSEGDIHYLFVCREKDIS